MYIVSHIDTSGVEQSQTFTDHFKAVLEQRRLRKEKLDASMVWDEGPLIIVGEMGAAGVIDGKLPNGETYHRNLRRKR
jgi:hypothetical protein